MASQLWCLVPSVAFDVAHSLPILVLGPLCCLSMLPWPCHSLAMALPWPSLGLPWPCHGLALALPWPFICLHLASIWLGVQLGPNQCLLLFMVILANMLL